MKNQYLINRELENLYGASFNCGIDKIGDNVVLKFYIESISNEYALNNENILKSCIETLLDIIFNPIQENGILNKEFLEIEKPTRELIINLVEKIYIYQDKTIDIIFTFKNAT